jgi:serine/threonine protein kinase
MDELVTLGVLGEGAFGRVTMVTWTPKAEQGQQSRTKVMALKQMSKRSVVESGQLEQVLRERVLAQRVSGHPFLLELYNAYQDNDAIYMLTNLFQGGELFSLLHSEEGDAELEPHMARFYVSNILLAIEYMHEKGLVYRYSSVLVIVLARLFHSHASRT